MKRVNIDRDVQSRRRIAASRPTPQPKPAEPPKDEPKEKIETAEAETEVVPVTKSKKSGRPPEGDA